MYLKKLELKGFKSFPNKTDIIFENGITSIVGPNGSGKSNVSDAIRWVLGEQSIKSLRGEKLEDVIFAGTDTKKPMNYCEVALTIDNTDNILNIDYSEVTIKRIAYKSGESEFYLNNKSCRLKDIKELLLDTGIGREGYSVIEQGKIDEILNSNSNNRRKVFDEACGISKYRYKKQEGEKNLKVTKENLDRIDDIFCEIQNQLKPLEVQKNKSLKYIDLREELRVLETNNYIREIEELDIQLKEINNHKQILQNQLKSLEESKNKEKISISNLENNLSILETKINNSNENLHKVQVDIDRKVANENLLNEKIKNININTEREENEVKNLELNIEKNKHYENELGEDKNKLDNKINLLKKEKDSIYKKTKEFSESLDLKEEKIENLKNHIINLMDEKNSKSVRVSSSKTNLDNMNARQASIKKELEDIYFKINEKNIDLNKNVELKNQSDTKLYNVMDLRKSEVENLEELKSQLKTIETNINNKNLMINEYSSKLNIYFEMEKHYEGFNRGVKEVLKNKNLNGILGAVAEVIKVPKKYETAVEVSLGASLQNIITDNEINAKNGIEYLNKNNLGRVTFLPLNIINGKKINLDDIPKIEGLLGIASDKISCDQKFKNIVEYMLGKTILVENINVAIKLGKITNHRYKIVTLEGDIFNPGGSLTGGSIKNTNNILSRKRLIEEFEQKISDLKVELEKNLNKRNNLEENIENTNKELNDLEIYIKDEEKLNLTIGSNIRKIEEEINNLNDIAFKLTREENGLNENLTYTKDFIYSLELEIRNIEEKISNVEKSIKEITLEKESDKEIYNSDIEILNNLNIDITKFLEIYKNIQKEIDRITEELSKFKLDLCEKKEKIRKDKIEKQELEESLILIKVEKEELKENVKNIEKKFEDYKIKKTDLIDNLKVKKEELKNLENHYLELKESIYKLDSKTDKLEMSQENYFSKLWNDYELTYHEALKLKNDDVIEKKKIEFLRSEIKKLGNVNIDSIQEYKEVKERYDFYKYQKEDLEKSIESIEKLIKDMESNMKYEFSSNFEKINETFITVYKKLFAGGYGELKLADPSNILESDVEIIAQPPGKKLKNINLLSGGEKALTAICVLFAILLIKPTPFCVLDEIEAPLDDANIYRFGEFLKDLSKNTQFIAITHRRGTMEASDYIYGVTMQERAISKVISLKLEEASDMIEKNIG